MKHSLLALVVTLAAGCGGTTPQVRYYQLVAPSVAPLPGTSKRVLVVDAFTTEGAYDDERIVYRADPYRLDYYQYQRWSATPGVMVSGFLQQALRRTGAFRSVVRDTTSDAALVLGGRIVAIEEIDESKTHWLGRLALELTLTDSKTGEVVWSKQYDEREPLPQQTPEGLARALSTVMTRIVSQVGPEIAEVAASREPQAIGSRR